ncbi:competence protein CoiA [Brevibacillus brevis]|uniref:competence protein CoiA n=1 Tax=Brevibacillus brevis TaxID=1393 RepID=UPI0007D89924|nr:competence protein CoiA family protein [Brevibacillus brevis]
MFKAKSNQDNQIINLKSKYWKDQRIELKKIGKEDGFVCQSCLKRVVLAWAAEPKTKPHFRHNPKNIDCDQNDESAEHAKGKELLFEYFQQRYSDVAEEVDIEHFIPQTGQIADVYVRFKNGQEWAIEYQRSNISLDTLKRRRELYKNAGIKDIWIVGENLAKIQSDDTISFKRISQVLFKNTSFGKNCLIALNPETGKVGIYRNITAINSRRYKSYKSFYDLDDIEFNLIGEPFGIRDVINYKGYQYDFVHSLKVSFPQVKLQKSDIPVFRFLALQDYMDHQDHAYINVPDELMKFIPKTCKEIDLDLEIVHSHKDIQEVGQYYPVKIYPSKWRSRLSAINMEKFKEVDFSIWGYAINSLYSMATIESRFKWLESGVPFVRMRRYLHDKGIIDKLYEPHDKIELVPFLSAAMKILGVSSNDVIRESVKRGFINYMDTDVTSEFAIELLKKLEVICVDRFNALGKGKIEIMF